MACWENDLISVLVWHRIKWKTKRIIEVFHLLVGLWYCGRCEGQTRVLLSVYVINIVSKQHSHSHIVNAFVQVFVQVASAQVAMTLKYLTFSILLSALALRTKVNYTIAFSTPDKPFQFQSRVAHNDVYVIRFDSYNYFLCGCRTTDRISDIECVYLQTIMLMLYARSVRKYTIRCRLLCKRCRVKSDETELWWLDIEHKREKGHMNVFFFW